MVDINTQLLNDPRYQKYLTDLKLYGTYQEGIYKGYAWCARRNLSFLRDSWNAYINIPDPHNQIIYDKIDNIAHYGITGGFRGMTGFDTCHYMDYQPIPQTTINLHRAIDGLDMLNIYVDLSPENIYRDLNYVRKCLFNMIDCLFDELGIGKDGISHG